MPPRPDTPPPPRDPAAEIAAFRADPDAAARAFYAANPLGSPTEGLPAGYMDEGDLALYHAALVRARPKGGAAARLAAQTLQLMCVLAALAGIASSLRRP